MSLLPELLNGMSLLPEPGNHSIWLISTKQWSSVLSIAWKQKWVKGSNFKSAKLFTWKVVGCLQLLEKWKPFSSQNCACLTSYIKKLTLKKKKTWALNFVLFLAGGDLFGRLWPAELPHASSQRIPWCRLEPHWRGALLVLPEVCRLREQWVSVFHAFQT